MYAIQMVAPMRVADYFEAPQAADGGITALKFSRRVLGQEYLAAATYEKSIQFWEVHPTGHTVPAGMKIFNGPVIDISWSDDRQRIYVAGCHNQVGFWDLSTDQIVSIGSHNDEVRTCHFINGPNYDCLMTGSFDKTLKFWDVRTPGAVMTLPLPGRCYSAAVTFPMAVVGTAGRGVVVYSLHDAPCEYRKQRSTASGQQSAMTVFKDDHNSPTADFTMGFVTATSGGRVGVFHLFADMMKEDYVFPCHRTINELGQKKVNRINDVAIHPIHGTLATGGSDGKFSYWDIYTRALLRTSEQMDQPVTKIAINTTGEIFAHAVSYDWTKGPAARDPNHHTRIFLRPCMEEMRPVYMPHDL